MGNLGNIAAEDADTSGGNEMPAVCEPAWALSSMRQQRDETTQHPAEKQRM